MSSKVSINFEESFDCYADALYKYLEFRGLDKVWLAKKLSNKNRKAKSIQENFSNWRKDCTKPREKTRNEIDEILGINIELSGTGSWHISRTKQKPASSHVTENEEHYVAEKAIPYYKEVKPGAGNGRVITQDESSEMVLVSLPRAYITHELQAAPSDLVIMRVWSDSMEPEIDDGDVIFVSRRVEPPFEGKIYIIRMNESYLCKYLQELPGQRIRVFSENDRYQAFEIQLGNDSQEDFEIFGRVIFNGQKR